MTDQRIVPSRRSHAALVLAAMVVAACSPDLEAVAPGPTDHVVLAPVAAAGRAVVVSVDDDRFYVPAQDSVRKLRIRVRDAAGVAMPDVGVDFSVVARGDTIVVGSAATDSTGLANVPRFATGERLGRQTLLARADGVAAATYSYLVLPAAYGGPSFRRCPIPPSLLPRYSALVRTRSALAAGDSVRVVAIGSSSTRGVGASTPESNYPARLQARLQAAYPGAAVTVYNKGINSQTAAMMLSRFDSDVIALRPTLAIWQTGTVDATGAWVPIDEYKDVLRRGISALTSRGIEVLLMDSQAYPNQPATYEDYQAATADVAAEFGVPIVNRYRLMRAYVASGRYTMADLLHTDSFHPNDLTYDCTAHWILAGLLSADVAS